MPITRKSNIFLLWLALNLIFFGFILIDARFRTRANLASIARRAALVKKLELTDLCLFTEARYTRHLSQADLHSAFQDYPMSVEHFPAGTLALPPRTIRMKNEKMD